MLLVMQFAKPEFFYGLFAIIIPVLVHFFQLRKFKIEPFTNTYFLKKIKLKTRKSSKFKELLILLFRILTIISIVIAFTKPYKSNLPNLNSHFEIIIYLDNSFSMEAKGLNGELLKGAVQQLIKLDFPTEKIILFTNDNTYKNLTKNELKKILININYTENQISVKEIFKKANYLFSNDKKALKELILISDFQNKNEPFDIPKISSFNINLIHEKPLKNINNFITKLEISSNTKDFEISIHADTNSDTLSSINVALYKNNKVVRRSILNRNSNFKTTFNISKEDSFNGKFLINDSSLSYDNEFYFCLEKKDKISVLEINQQKTNYFRRIFTEDEFILKTNLLNEIDYSKFNSYDLIILNEINNLSNTLINNLIGYKNNGGSILIVPHNNTILERYNKLISVEKLKFTNYILNKKKITKINFNHPVFKKVFKRKITNFKYPFVEKYFELNGSLNSILKFEDGNDFLVQANNLFLFTAPINRTNSDFINSPIIVPTMYGIGKSIFKQNRAYYEIGNSSELDLKYKLKKGDVIKIKNDNKIFIPSQTNNNSKVKIKFDNIPLKAGHSYLLLDNDTIHNLSFNYQRKESILSYYDINNQSSISSYNELKNKINSLKSEEIINELWKWFAIFALLFLAMEVLILKFFK